jgi:hypothetical protein
MTQAIYDLGKMPTTFDFASWACYARTCGATKVHFIIDGPIAQWKYPADIAWKRFANILIPLCKLAGLEYTVGGREEGREFPYLAGHLNKLYKQLGRIEKLKPTQRQQRSPYVTITLRDSFRNKYRNSNLPAWDRFSKYLEARNVNVMVLPECEDAPMNVEHRMDLYCGATMNLGVPNGPMALCVFGDSPYITINQFPDRGGEKVQYDQKKLMEKQGMPEGSQFAFANSRQRLVYEPDDYENIVRAYESMESVQEKAA